MPVLKASSEIIRVTVDPQYLEDLLECLAGFNVPIDPVIQHGSETVVTFAVEDPRRIRKALLLAGFQRVSIQQ